MKPSLLHATLPRKCCTQQNGPETQHGHATGAQHESLKALALKVLARNKAMQQARNNKQENVLQTVGRVLHAQQPSVDTEFLTIEDLPDLANRLRAQGWIVKRVGDELVCTPRRPWHRIQ
jgi:hypothetical protein